jgi:hypothetical protein
MFDRSWVNAADDPLEPHFIIRTECSALHTFTFFSACNYNLEYNSVFIIERLGTSVAEASAEDGSLLVTRCTLVQRHSASPKTLWGIHDYCAPLYVLSCDGTLPRLVDRLRRGGGRRSHSVINMATSY